VSEPAPFQCLMVGLPETGKTTFLAALWHVAKSHEVPGSLRLEKREGDQEYLNNIANSWSKCAELIRTPGEGEMGVAILLRDPDTSRVVRLSIPDMSGELYKTQWESRSCTSEFADLVSEAGGCLFFLHPGKLVETQWIADANATLEEWAHPGTVGRAATVHIRIIRRPDPVGRDRLRVGSGQNQRDSRGVGRRANAAALAVHRLEPVIVRRQLHGRECSRWGAVGYSTT
jgi:Double-GTPase 1